MYNDAEFTKDDWKGIISPSVGSLKRDNPEKVGKFGIGVSSVYHVTGTTTSAIMKDLTIQFCRLPLDIIWQHNVHDGPPAHLPIQGGEEMEYDEPPQQRVMGQQSRSEQTLEGDKLNFDYVIIHDLTFKEILKHLCLPDIFSGQPVPGTIFRIPLRAETSELSDNIYTTRYVVYASKN